MRWNDLWTRQLKRTNLLEEASNPKIKCIFSFKRVVCEFFYQRAFILFAQRHKYILTQISEQVFTVSTTVALPFRSQEKLPSNKPNHLDSLPLILSSQSYKMISTNDAICGNLNREAMFGSYITRAPSEGPYSRTLRTGQLSGQNQLPPNISGEVNTITGATEEWVTSEINEEPT